MTTSTLRNTFGALTLALILALPSFAHATESGEFYGSAVIRNGGYTDDAVFGIPLDSDFWEFGYGLGYQVSPQIAIEGALRYTNGDITVTNFVGQFGSPIRVTADVEGWSFGADVLFYPFSQSGDAIKPFAGVGLSVHRVKMESSFSGSSFSGTSDEGYAVGQIGIDFRIAEGISLVPSLHYLLSFDRIESELDDNIYTNEGFDVWGVQIALRHRF